MDAWDTVVDTLVVRDGRVAFAGRRDEVNVSGAEEVVDLGGRTVVPGLVDAHGHLMHLARARLTLDAGGASSEAEVAERVAARAAKTPRGEWLGGRGWDQNRWPGRQWPTRASLDRAASHHPVALTRIDGHATWANSAALAAAGIDRTTREPTGGRILKDERGDPTGVLDRHGPAPDPAGGAAPLPRALRPGRPRGDRRVPGGGAHRHPRDGRRALRDRVVPPARRAWTVPVPQLRGGGRALGVDVDPLPGRTVPRRSATGAS